MFPKGGCWAEELSSVEKAGEQAGFRNLAFVPWVLGKLSGVQPGHDVVQMYLLSGGREARLGLAVRMPCFFIPEAKHTRTAPTQRTREGGLYGFQME